jgi:O-antigen ligase
LAGGGRGFPGEFELKPHRDPRAVRGRLPAQPRAVSASPRPALAALNHVRNGPFTLVAVFWVVLIYDADIFLTDKTGVPFYRLPIVAAAFLAIRIGMRWQKQALFWPLVVFTLMHVVASVLADNAGLARGPAKFLIYVCLFFAGTAIYADSPRKATVLLNILLFSMLWFGLPGLIGAGRVTWHPLLNNEDSYGPLMVIMLPLAYFYSLAADSARWRWIARFAFVIALAGAVVSLARGAALAAGLVLLYMLFRTPRRGRFIGLLMLAAVIAIPIVTSFFSIDSYIAEIASASQGDNTRTGLWMAAVKVFFHSPLYGVGAGNFGVVANQIAYEQVRALDLPGVYMIAVHNPHFEILAEEGLIGIACWLLILWNTHRWIRQMRRPGAQEEWRRRGGGLDLRLVSYGLEGMLLAYLGTSIFYNQLYVHWIWSLMTIAFLLAERSKPTGVTAQASRRVRTPLRGAFVPSRVAHNSLDGR